MSALPTHLLVQTCLIILQLRWPVIFQSAEDTLNTTWMWRCRWCNTSIVWFWHGVPCFLYHCIIELTSSRAENCAIERFTCPMLKTLLLQKRSTCMEKKKKKKIFEGKNHLWNGSGQGENHTVKKPADHSGSKNSFNKDDCKLLSVAERWQDFLRDAAEHGKRGRGACVLIWGEQRDDYLFD